MLDFCYVRIQERFKNFSPAYRYFDLNFNNRVSFNEFILGMENLKVKLSSRDQLQIFNYLDQGKKGYIDYNDFCGLSEERRNNMDPAAFMLKEYKDTGKVQYSFGKKQARSPSRQNAHRIAEASSNGNNSSIGGSAISKDKSELHKYLGALEIEDLEMIRKDRKSTKNNPGGPIIYGAKSPWGKAKVGHSIPRHL